MKPIELQQFKKQVNKAIDILKSRQEGFNSDLFEAQIDFNNRVKEVETNIKLIEKRIDKYLELTTKRYVRLKWMILILAFLLFLSIVLG